MMVLTTLIAVLALAGQRPPSAEAPADYLVGPHDVLNIVVFGEADLSRTVTLDAEGSFDLPHIGRVRAGGMTARGIGNDVTKRLKEFYVNPQVSVEVARFRSQNVIVMGYVNAPGRYPLSGTMSVLEMLAMAGSPTSAAASYVQISRPTGSEPRLPHEEPGGGTTLRLTMKQLQNGLAPAGFALRDGDTISVPKAETVTVIGHVKTTGAIVLEGDMTVYDVIARAGGVTDRGALNRVKVLRLIDGTMQLVKGMKLGDLVRPGDTIDVPQRYF
jgi:polysaccharide export outer membrane protein